MSCVKLCVICALSILCRVKGFFYISDRKLDRNTISRDSAHLSIYEGHPENNESC